MVAINGRYFYSRPQFNRNGLNVTTSTGENDVLVVSVDIVGNVASFVGQFECLNGRGMESVKTVKVFAASGSSAWTTWSEWTKWLVSASRILVMLPSVTNLAICVCLCVRYRRPHG